MNVFINKDGNRQGPFTVSDINQMRASGKILDTDWAWYEGLTEWIPVSKIPGVGLPPVAAPIGLQAPPIAPAPPVIATRGEIPWGARIATGILVFGVSCVVLFFLFWIVAMMIGAMMVGMNAAAAQHATTYDQGHQIGEEVGRKFGEEYALPIAGFSALGSFLFSALLAWIFGFTNLLPWCRRR